MTDITGFLNLKEERGPTVVKVIDMVVRLTSTYTIPTEKGGGYLKWKPPPVTIPAHVYSMLDFMSLLTPNHWWVVSNNLYPSYLYGRKRTVVFNATFNSISVISWRLVLLMEETTDMSEVTDNLYNIMLYRVHLAMNRVRTHNFGGNRQRLHM